MLSSKRRGGHFKELPVTAPKGRYGSVLFLAARLVSRSPCNHRLFNGNLAISVTVVFVLCKPAGSAGRGSVSKVTVSHDEDGITAGGVATASVGFIHEVDQAQICLKAEMPDENWKEGTGGG